MKVNCRIVAIILALSCILSLSGCNNKSVDEVKVNNGQEKISNNEEVSEASKVSEEAPKSKYENAIEIVSPGYEEVDNYLEGEYDNNAFQGVVLIAEGDDIKFAKGYGYADLDENRKNEVTTRFAIASNTKQITAAAIMQLVEEGKVNVNDTIDKYFPKFKYGSEITVKELLQMRSGLMDYLNDPVSFMQDSASSKILDDYNKKEYFDEYVSDDRWSQDLILNNLYLSHLLFTPGQAFDYCNTNYYLLGLIIEEASGMSYEEYVKKNIFEPCKMLDASMTAQENDAKGHGSDKSGEIVANPNFTYAAGNIYANIYDVFRWNRMLHKGNIVSDASYNEMITPTEEGKYGYGLFIEDGVIRHSGVIDGFNSNTQYDPVKDITIIVLENADETISLIDAKYETSIIGGLIN